MILEEVQKEMCYLQDELAEARISCLEYQEALCESQFEIEQLKKYKTSYEMLVRELRGGVR